MTNSYAECDDGQSGGGGTPAEVSAAMWIENIVVSSAGGYQIFTGTPEVTIAALTDGMRLSFRTLNPCYSPIKLDVGFGAKSVKKDNSAELDDDDFSIRDIVEVIYNAGADNFTLAAIPAGAAIRYRDIGLLTDNVPLNAVMGYTSYAATFRVTSIVAPLEILGLVDRIYVGREYRMLMAVDGSVVASASLTMDGATAGTFTLYADVEYSVLATATNAFRITTIGGIVPAFRASASGTTSITAGFNKVTLDVETFDTNANFSASRFTATIAGYYYFDAAIYFASSAFVISAVLYKNGATYSSSVPGPVMRQVRVCDLVFLEIGDYVELFGYSATTQDANPGANVTFMSGHLVRKK